jgi:4-hydroxybenzoate polyprenyltransferase
LGGFFLFSGTEQLKDFPPKYSLGILLIFLLAENIKNLKDIEGDRREGIKTLPVLLGEKAGPLGAGILVFIAVLLVPIFFFFNLLTLVTALGFGTLLFFLANRKPYSENAIFITYFIFGLVFLWECTLR